MNDDFPPVEAEADADADTAPAMKTSVADDASVDDGVAIEAPPGDLAGLAQPIEETPVLEPDNLLPAMPEFAVPPLVHAGDRSDRFRPPVSQIPVEMQAVIGRVKVSVADLMGAEPGARFKLDSKFGEPIELQVNGKRIGYGEIVADDRDNLVGIRMISLEPDL